MQAADEGAASALVSKVTIENINERLKQAGLPAASLIQAASIAPTAAAVAPVAKEPGAPALSGAGEGRGLRFVSGVIAVLVAVAVVAMQDVS